MVAQPIVSSIYHHTMLLLFLTAAFILGMITGASLAHHNSNSYKPVYQRAFKIKG